MEYFRDLKCKTCKKEFAVINIVDYAYKLKSKTDNTLKYFCSWKCLQQYKKDHNIKNKLKLENFYR